MSAATTATATTPAISTTSVVPHVNAPETSAMIAEVLAEGGLDYDEPAVAPVSGYKTLHNTPDTTASELFSDEVVTPTSSGLPSNLSQALERKDPLAIVEALGLDDVTAASLFKIPRETFVAGRAARRETREAQETLDRTAKEHETKFTDLKNKLLGTYGDPDAIRKAWRENDFEAAVEGIEKFIEVPISEFMKAYIKHFKGEGTQEFANNRRLRELEKKELESNKQTAEPAKVEPTASIETPEKIAKACDWIRGEIRKDKLSSITGIEQLVYNVLKRDHKKGVRSPLKALDIVRAELTAAGVLSAPTAPVQKKQNVMEKSPSRRNQTGQFTSTANTRVMTESELVKSVLSEMNPGDYWRD